ncbi:MAG: tyrosine--tRNA ligase, partial [Clostridia bacterium]|nr:tyrosine--tRNA ligase [Clostridia bacterium]
RINAAKERLAYEVTKLVHGQEKAEIARSQAKAAFSGGGEMLTKEVSGVTTVVDVMVAADIAKSKGEARRLIEQGGVSVNEEKVTDVNAQIPASEFTLQKGKKVRLKIIVKD